jgi:hypothetical protein
MYVRTCTALHSRIPHLATCTTLELYKPHLQPGVLYYWTQTLQCCDIMTLQFRGENKSTACSDYRYTHTWVAHTTLELYKPHLQLHTHTWVIHTHTWVIHTTLGLYTPHLSYTNHTCSYTHTLGLYTHTLGLYTPHLGYTHHTWAIQTTLGLHTPHMSYTNHTWVTHTTLELYKLHLGTHTTLELYKPHLGYTHHTWAIQTTLGLHTPQLGCKRLGTWDSSRALVHQPATQNTITPQRIVCVPTVGILLTDTIVSLIITLTKRYCIYQTSATEKRAN